MLQPGMGWYHDPSGQIAGNFCRLEPAELHILEAGCFSAWSVPSVLIKVVSLLETADRNKQYNTVKWNENQAKARVRRSSYRQVLSCLAQGSVRKKKIR